jgi:hypothetical protein
VRFFLPQDAQVQQSSFAAHGAVLLRRYIWFTSPFGNRTCGPESEAVVALALCHWHSELWNNTGTLTTKLVFEQLQSEQYTGRDTGATSVGVLGKPLGIMAINGSN